MVAMGGKFRIVIIDHVTAEEFPFKLAFAMSINKAKEDKMTVVFARGQIYVNQVFQNAMHFLTSVLLRNISVKYD